MNTGAQQPGSRSSAFGLVVLLFVVAIIIGIGLTSTSPSAPTQAKTGFQTTQLDLGEVLWVTSAPFSVPFLNADETDVAVASVTSSCGCTTFASEWTNRRLGPKESFEIKGEVAAGNRPGDFERNLSLVLAYGRAYQSVLRIRVKSTYELSPLSLHFKEVDIESDEAVAQFLVFRSQASRISAVESDSAWLRCSSEPRGDETVLAVHVDPHFLTFGLNSGRLTVHITDKHQPIATIGVVATGVGQLRAVPGFAVLEQGRETTIAFIASDGSTPRIARAESRNEVLCRKPNK